ncbi:hypothetical protein cypCar_00021878 [Cyprinus carpio]|nr:hypothetical protein cypCar_00021878 [Cyprinus carpio]
MCAGPASAAGNCSYKALIEHLGLANDDIQMTYLRPVVNWRTPTSVYTDLYVTSITEVDEKAQSLSTQVTIAHGWYSDFTKWNPDDFCGIKVCPIKKDMVWTPDIVITERRRGEELIIRPFSGASFLTLSSKQAFQTQGEWEFLSINMSKANVSTLGELQDLLIYKITMKRRPLLYVINFLMPVFYFLILDLASYFIDSSGGEKLGFKITLLLAISVLLLLLQDMLPSTASDVPLIGVYCVVIFSLIGISVLETILVNFLMAKGNRTGPGRTTESLSALSDAVKDTKGTPDLVTDRHEEQLPALDVLKQILVEFQAAATHQNQQERKCLSWTRVATIIDVTFYFLYVTTVIVFLITLFRSWFLVADVP